MHRRGGAWLGGYKVLTHCSNRLQVSNLLLAQVA
jgi:hypothetical protein